MHVNGSTAYDAGASGHPQPPSRGLDATPPQLWFTHLTVLPPMRRRSVGSALYARILLGLREHGTHGVDGSGTRIGERPRRGIAFAERRGFASWPPNDLRLTRAHGLDPPRIARQTGNRDRPLGGSARARPRANEVTFEANPDVPGSEDWSGEPFEVWGRMHRPHLMFAAVAGDEVVGFAELFTTDARPGVAVHMCLASNA